MIHIHETVNVLPGRMQAYLRGLLEVFVPVAAECEWQLVGLFQTSGTTGPWPEVTIVWGVADWAAYARSVEAVSRHPGSRLWADHAISCRTTGVDLLLVPLSFSPRPPVPRAGDSRRVCLQVHLRAGPDTRDRLVERMGSRLAPGLGGLGLEVEACWSAVLRPLELVGLWSAADVAAMSAALDGLGPDGGGLLRLLGEDAGVAELTAKVLLPAAGSPIGGAAGSLTTQS
jgi:hypothetical protein